jgi:septal ring factor EnvC (AmiA/AmiB activator)
VTQFFDETQNFCQLLADKAVRSNPRDLAEVPSAAVLLHESEIQKLRLQHELDRVQRQLDESSAETHTLSEQIKNEHHMIAQLTGKTFPDAPECILLNLIRR